MKRLFLSLVLTLLFSACYHATVTTGARPGNVQIENKWASGWVLGLVPPSVVETMERCPNGVATVETQLSFLNQLVNGLTMGIYTPMEIVVTCAEGGDEAPSEALSPEAAALLLRAGQPVVIPR